MIIKKRRFYVDYEKEEAWLNGMAAKGYALKEFRFPTYIFEPIEPGEYIYRIELLEDIPTAESSLEYFDFVKELDVEVVTSHFRWVYFRKKAALGPFEIHSDLSSKIKHHKKIFSLQMIIGAANLVIAFSNIILGLINGFSFYFGAINLILGIIILSFAFKNQRKISKLLQELVLNE